MDGNRNRVKIEEKHSGERRDLVGEVSAPPFEVDLCFQRQAVTSFTERGRCNEFHASHPWSARQRVITSKAWNLATQRKARNVP